MGDKTDQQLYQEFLEGRKESFEEIVIKYKNRLIYFIQKYIKDMDMAEDLAQDVFVYLLIHPNHYDLQYSLKTYLYIIAKSKALNYKKKEKRLLPLEENQIADIEELEEKVFQMDNIKQIQKAIHQLKIEYQRAIYLVDIEKLTYQEICEILGKTMPQVKVLIYRARKSLKKMVRKEEMDI